VRPGDELRRDVEQLVGCELLSLHAIHLREPLEELVRHARHGHVEPGDVAVEDLLGHRRQRLDRPRLGGLHRVAGHRLVGAPIARHKGVWPCDGQRSESKTQQHVVNSMPPNNILTRVNEAKEMTRGGKEKGR